MNEDEFVVNEYEVITPFFGLRAGQFTQYRSNEAQKYVEAGCLKLVVATPKAKAPKTPIADK